MAEDFQKKTRNSFNQQAIDHIVNQVLSGHIKPYYKDILPYASLVLGCEIKQTTAANWFSVHGVSLIDIRRKLEARNQSVSHAGSRSPAPHAPHAPQYPQNPVQYTQHPSSHSSTPRAYPQNPVQYTQHPSSHSSTPRSYPTVPIVHPQVSHNYSTNEAVPVNYYSFAPTIKRKPKRDAMLGQTIITYVTSQIMARDKVTLEKIALHLKTIEDKVYSLDTIRSICQKFALTYMLPGVGPPGITYEEYLQIVYQSFPGLNTNY